MTHDTNSSKEYGKYKTKACSSKAIAFKEAKMNYYKGESTDQKVNLETKAILILDIKCN